jgi:hypothetical protein
VRQREREAAAQAARIGIAEADFFPQVSITGTIGRQAREFSQLWDQASFTGSITPGFRWNILNYGRILNNVRAEEARFHQAVLAYQDTVLRAQEQVENGLAKFQQEQKRLKHLEQVHDDLERLVDIGRVRFEVGGREIEEYLEPQRQLIDLMVGTGRFSGAPGATVDIQVRQTGAVTIGGTGGGGGGGLVRTRASIPFAIIETYRALGGGWRMRFAPPPQHTLVAQPFEERQVPVDGAQVPMRPLPPTEEVPAPPTQEPTPSP